MEIDCVAHRVDVPLPGEIDMGDLAERVYAGISASGAGNHSTLAGKGGYSVGKNALHRNAVVLHLPADERRAVIFDGELVARHRRFTAARLNARSACRAKILLLA